MNHNEKKNKCSVQILYTFQKVICKEKVLNIEKQLCWENVTEVYF